MVHCHLKKKNTKLCCFLFVFLDEPKNDTKLFILRSYDAWMISTSTIRVMVGHNIFQASFDYSNITFI